MERRKWRNSVDLDGSVDNVFLVICSFLSTNEMPDDGLGAIMVSIVKGVCRQSNV